MFLRLWGGKKVSSFKLLNKQLIKNQTKSHGLLKVQIIQKIQRFQITFGWVKILYEEQQQKYGFPRCLVGSTSLFWTDCEHNFNFLETTNNTQNSRLHKPRYGSKSDFIFHKCQGKQNRGNSAKGFPGQALVKKRVSYEPFNLISLRDFT